jgi:hypothetical protein
MQGLQINTPAKNDKVNSFVKSLELSKRNENITVWLASRVYVCVRPGKLLCG